jgi:clan AA aspartic protease (TIGR02281 family)
MRARRAAILREMSLPAFVLLAALAAAPARADTVYLANGNQMKGVVVSRSKTALVLDIGYGTITLNPADVVKIVRGVGGDGDGGLRRARFASGEKVPAGADALDSLYREALARREKALDAKERDKSLDAERVDIVARLPDSKQRYRDDAANLAGLSPNADARGYNGAVAELNATGAGIQADQLRLEQIEEERRGAEAEVHGYLDAWRALDKGLRADAAGLAAGGAEQKDYVAWLKGESAAMAKDFRSDTIPSQTRGDRLIVKVVINGKEAGRFLVDTGATTTLLYRGIASRLALGPEALVGHTKSRVADGRAVDADIVRLDSMQVGRSRVDGALAAVIPVDEPDFDGLLGMTFLSHFVTSVDTANGKLVLEDLK